MGRVSRDEIIEWKRDGWSFRVKEVKGKRYITRRKGGKERSLGRFDDGLWSMIESSSLSVQEIVAQSKQGQDTEVLVERILLDLRSYDMSRSCDHIVDGFCHYWRYGEIPGFFMIVDRSISEGLYAQIEPRNREPFWVFKALPFYCKNCPSYTRLDRKK